MTDIDAVRPPLPTISRLTALFQRGEVVRVGEDDNGPVMVWINALTAVEREECILDGAVAQATERVLNGPGSAAYETMVISLESASRDEIVDALCMNRATEAWALAQDDLHADEEWRGDKLLLIERGDVSIKAGLKMSEGETAAFVKLNEEYLAAWKARAIQRVDAMRSEYRALETRELIAAHLKAWTDSNALKAQAGEYRISQLLFSTRVCRATVKDDESYDHSACEDHSRLVFPDRSRVRSAPDELTSMLIPVADRIDRSGGDALGKR